MSINPNLPSGFRDYLPKDMIPRQRMLDIIRTTFERFGFVPLDTPGLEREEVLTGGDPNFRKQIYRAKLRDSTEELALRFDLTVPLARVIALYQSEIERPFKRYQVGKVWRGERAQAGRFREFIQFDADTVGTANMMADAEIVTLMYETLRALGVPNFLIRVNNRKILNGLAEYVGFPTDKNVDVLRTIDKLDKIAWDGVRTELMAEPMGFTDTQCEAIKGFIDLRAGNQRETLTAVRALMANSPVAQNGIEELESIVGHVEALGVPADAWTIDLSVARGLGYYTGPVFEAILQDLPEIGSVFSGGRYDDLVSRFSDMNVPATGASVGVDRLFAALEKLELVQSAKTVSQVLFMNFDPACALSCERIATTLRNDGIPTEIYLGKETSFKGQLAYATRQQIPVLIIIGSNEATKGTATVKDMVARKQVEVPQDQVLTTVREVLKL